MWHYHKYLFFLHFAEFAYRNCFIFFPILTPSATYVLRLMRCFPSSYSMSQIYATSPSYCCACQVYSKHNLLISRFFFYSVLYRAEHMSINYSYTYSPFQHNQENKENNQFSYLSQIELLCHFRKTFSTFKRTEKYKIIFFLIDTYADESHSLLSACSLKLNLTFFI